MRDYGNTNAAPYASAPAVGLTGDTYWNTTTKLLYVSDGTAWIAVDNTGSLIVTNVAATNFLNCNTANAATGGRGALAGYSTTGIMLSTNDRWSPPAPTLASWNLELDTGGAQYAQLLHRAAGAANGSSDHRFEFRPNGDLLITGNNAYKLSGTAWVATCDRRLKDEIADYATGLAAVCQLQPRTFLFNGKGGTQAGLRGYGFVADEIAPVMPETVGTTAAKLDAADTKDTDIQTVDASNLVLALVNAVKELTARLTAAETQLAALAAG